MSGHTLYNVLLSHADGIAGGHDAAVAALAAQFRLPPSDAARIVEAMPLVVRKRATDEESHRLVARLRALGFEARRIPVFGTTEQPVPSITGVLHPVRPGPGEPAAGKGAASPPSATGIEPEGNQPRTAQDSGTSNSRMTSRDRLRRLSGQFSTWTVEDVDAVRKQESGTGVATDDAPAPHAESTASRLSPSDELASGSDRSQQPADADTGAPRSGSQNETASQRTRADDTAMGSGPLDATMLEQGPLDVVVNTPTLAPSSDEQAIISPNQVDIEGDRSGAATPAGGPTDDGFEITGNWHAGMDSSRDAGDDVAVDLTSDLDAIAADLPTDHPWPDVTGMSEIPVQQTRSPSPPPVQSNRIDAGDDDVAGMTEMARRSSVLDEMMSMGADDESYEDTPSIDDVIAGNAPIPSASPRGIIDGIDFAGEEVVGGRLTHTSLEDSLSDISGAQHRGSTGPTAAVAGEASGSLPHLPQRRKGPGGGVGLLVVATIVIVIIGISGGLWWTTQKRATSAWQFEQAPRHVEMIEMMDGVRAISACALLASGDELCRYSVEHVASWFPDLDAPVTMEAAETCYATVQTSSTERRMVFDCRIRVDTDGEQEAWELLYRESEECTAAPGGLQPGETAECLERVNRNATRDGVAALAPFVDQRATVWEFDRMRDSFSTNVGYFRVAELRVRPADAGTGLPILVAWALDIDRVVERYRPDGTMLEEIAYIHDPARHVGSPTLAPAPPPDP